MITVMLGLIFAVLYGYMISFVPLPLGLGMNGLAIYVHIPCAWVGSLFLALCAYYSFRYMANKSSRCDAQAAAAARIGLLFSILATLTGAVFAKYAWGHYWNWDPRQTTMVIVLMIYTAYFALRSSLDRADLRARLSAAYAALAGVVMPLFVYVLPRIYPSLHPSPVIASPGGLGMDMQMLVFLVAVSLSFTLLALHRSEERRVGKKCINRW